MPSYDKTIGRIRVTVSEDGARHHAYAHGATIECPDGWNKHCQIVRHTVSIEELHDLRYLIDRAIAAVEPKATA